MSAAEIAAAYAVTPERIAEWSARIDGYADYADAEVLEDRRRLVFRSLVLAWLMGLSAGSRAETVYAAAALVRERLAAYDEQGTSTARHPAADVPHRRGCLLASNHRGECDVVRGEDRG